MLFAYTGKRQILRKYQTEGAALLFHPSEPQFKKRQLIHSIDNYGCLVDTPAPNQPDYMDSFKQKRSTNKEV